MNTWGSTYNGDSLLVDFTEFDNEDGNDDGGERGDGRHPEELWPLLGLRHIITEQEQSVRWLCLIQAVLKIDYRKSLQYIWSVGGRPRRRGR